MFNWIGKNPLRKPLALYAALLVGGVIVLYAWRGLDIPGNMATLLQWFGGLVIGAYYASSSYEATRGDRDGK